MITLTKQNKHKDKSKETSNTCTIIQTRREIQTSKTGIAQLIQTEKARNRHRDSQKDIDKE